MSNVKIVVEVATADAARALKDFCTQGASGLKVVEKAAHGTEGVFVANKMAMMEMEHSVRSLADGMIAGINPMRMLAMEGPRLMQAGTMMTDEFKTKLLGFLPILGGIGAAIAAGAIAWHFYGDALVDPTKRARDLADALQKVPGILKQIETAQRAGSLSPEAAQKYRDLLPGGAAKLYNVETVADAYGGHAATIKNGAGGIFGEEFPQLTTDRYIRNSRTGKIIGERQAANDTDRTTYANQQLRSGGIIDATDKTKPGDEALAELHDTELKAQKDSEIGIQKEIDRIKDRYAIELRAKEELRQVAIHDNKWNTDEEKQYQQFLINTESAKQASIAEIQQHATEEAATKAAEAQKKIQEAAAKDGAEQLKSLEKEITANQDQEGKIRGQFAVAEYVQRAALLVKLLAQGKITEAEYSDKMADAQHKATDEVKTYRAELERVAAIKQEIARADLEAKIKRVESDKTLTTPEKGAQLAALYQKEILALDEAIADAQKQTTDSTVDQFELQKKIHALEREKEDIKDKGQDLQASGTVSGNLKEQWTGFSNQVGNLSQDMAHMAMSPFEGMRQGLASALDTLLEKGTTFKKFMGTIAMDIGHSMITAFSDMVANWIMSHVVMAGVSAAWHAVTTGQQAVATSAQVGIHTAGEAAKTGATAAGAGSRAGIGVMETAWHAVQTGFKVAIHAAGQIAMTAMTLIQSLIRHAIVFLELQPYILLAAIEAAASVAMVPIVGPILAPIAFATTFAALEGLAAFERGGRPVPGQMALVGEAGPELWVPDSAGTIIPAHQTAAMLAGSRHVSSGVGAGTGAGASQGGNNVSVYHFTDTKEQARQIERDPAHEKWVIDSVRKQVHKVK